MIGDTMSTDILGGIQMGYKTILVLSGSTTREDMKKFAFSPDYMVPSIAEVPLPKLLERELRIVA